MIHNNVAPLSGMLLEHKYLTRISYQTSEMVRAGVVCGCRSTGISDKRSYIVSHSLSIPDFGFTAGATLMAPDDTKARFSWAPTHLLIGIG